jgi:DNA polymerase bacteriophage-type
MILFGDLETYSEIPITCGVHKYAEKVEILLFAWAVDDEPVQVWDVTLDPAPPAELVEALALCDEVWFHNAQFDRTVLRRAMPHLCPPLEKWRDTMVQAMAHSLPGKLAEISDVVLRLPADKAKDKAGKALIQLFCRPIKFSHTRTAADFPGETLKARKAALKEWAEAEQAKWPGRATRETHPAKWREFLIYAGMDIEAMREAHKRMPMWNYRGAELALWHLDQRINDRGVYIDLELAECTVNAVERAQEGLREDAQRATGGAVESATKRDALIAHILEQYGVPLPDMQKATLERRIADPDIPEGVKELLRIRLQASTTSTSKYATLIKCTGADSRLRGLLQFNGASRTGRWAGRLFQPQNLPSRGLLPQEQIEQGIVALKGGFADLFFDNIMHLTSSAIRGCICAPPGRKLVVADLSNIEGRDQAWLAGEDWKLRAFAEFDTVLTAEDEWLSGPEYFALCRDGTPPALALNEKGEPIRRGHDLYKMSYGKSFNVRPEEVTKDQRQVGKVQELALGYEGGVGAFVTFAAGYGIDLDELAAKAARFIPGEVWGQARIMLEWHRKHGRDPAAALGLPEQTWLVCESFKLGWRTGHANIKTYWRELDATVRDAISAPGVTFNCGKVKIRRDGAWLRIVLPSGRALCYPGPLLQPEKRKKKGEVDAETADADALDDSAVQAPVEGRTKITYMGMNQYTRKWSRIDTYGGKIFENICQAVARDVMAYNMPAIEAAGYQIVLTVHDEVVCEAPDDPRYSAEQLAALLCATPPWARGMPLAAAGFEAYRYKKD